MLLRLNQIPVPQKKRETQNKHSKNWHFIFCVLLQGADTTATGADGGVR
jgi:hypothetical protein